MADPAPLVRRLLTLGGAFVPERYLEAVKKLGCAPFQPTHAGAIMAERFENAEGAMEHAAAVYRACGGARGAASAVADAAVGTAASFAAAPGLYCPAKAVPPESPLAEWLLGAANEGETAAELRARVPIAAPLLERMLETEEGTRAVDHALFERLPAAVTAAKDALWGLRPLPVLPALRALVLAMSVPAAAARLARMPFLVTPALYGARMEQQSPLSAYFGVTAMTQRAEVGVSARADEVRARVRSTHRLLAEAVLEVLRGPGEVARAALLSWFASVSLSNWTRTRMRANQRGNSTGGFLLNVSSVMLAVLERLTPPPPAELAPEPAYCAVASRFSGAHETRTAAGDAEARRHARRAEEARRDASRPTADADAEVLRAACGRRHESIVCDRCRTADIVGERYKCANCADYDLCAACEALEHAEALGLAAPGGVVFSCPYPGCDAGGMHDADLRVHVADEHAARPDLVRCPVCTANGHTVRLCMPAFSAHLRQLHGDSHDPARHVFVKMRRMVSHFHHRNFEPLPPLDLRAEGEEEARRALASGGGLEPDHALCEAARMQAAVQHRVSCSACGAAVRGIAFTCYNCGPGADAYHLCEACECGDEHGHDPSHVFVKLRRPLTGAGEREAEERAGRRRRRQLAGEERREERKGGNDDDDDDDDDDDGGGGGDDDDDDDDALPDPLGFIPAMPNVFPPSLLGSRGFSVETEWLFLTLQAVRVGALHTCKTYRQLTRSPLPDDRATRLRVERLRDGMGVHVLERHFVEELAGAYACLARWLLAVAHSGEEGAARPSAAAGRAAGHLASGDGGLPRPPPAAFACLPEFLLENAADALSFLARHGRAVANRRAGPLVRLFVALLASPGYVRNPYLRASLAESLTAVLGLGVSDPRQRAECRELAAELWGGAVAVRHLVPSLVRLHVDIELGGSSVQFFDKFNVRHSTGTLLDALVPSPAHLSRLGELVASADGETMERLLRFASSLLTDFTYLMDECLQRAAVLRQQEERDADGAAAMFVPRGAEAARAEQRSLLRTASTLCGLILRLWWRLTKERETVPVLLRPELVERCAHTANHYAWRLAGPKRAAHEVSARERSLTGFEPARWLLTVADVYASLAEASGGGGEASNRFVEAVVRDETFRPELLGAVSSALEGEAAALEPAVPDAPDPAEARAAREALRSARRRFDGLFAARASEAYRLAAAEADELGDVPEEFLDPILSTVMEEPVTLPSSGMTMDRSVILRHLLHNGTDPFNRQPLAAADLVANDALRERIEAFRRERSGGGGGVREV